MKTKNQTTFYFEYKIDTAEYIYNANGEPMKYQDVSTQIFKCWIRSSSRLSAREILVEKLVDVGIPFGCIWINNAVKEVK